MDAEAHREGPFSAESGEELARLRTATMELILERGIDTPGLLDQVLDRAGVAPAAFAREFDDLADCCMRIYLANIDEFDRVVFGADPHRGAWRDRLRAVAYAAARYVRDRPVETRFDMVQMLAIGDRAQAHRDRYVNRIVDLIDEGRQDPGAPDSVGRGVAEGTFGAIYESILRATESGTGTRFADSFVPELMYIAVRPYLGHEVAKQELSIPAPPEPGR